MTIATFYDFRWTCAIAVLPRLCLAALRFAQPFLIQRIIDFVGEPSTKDTNSIAGGLIGATALVYIGMAVRYLSLRGFYANYLCVVQITRCYYEHINFQLMTMIRGGLVALIFEKTLGLEAAKAREGDAVSLMSADIEGIEPGIELIHEIWASVIELGIALYLLQMQVGAACFFVVIPAAGKFFQVNTPRYM